MNVITTSPASRPVHRLARALGWFSVGLGLAELLAPRRAAQAAGLEDQDLLMRAYGARELATGAAILSSQQPLPWIMARVAGDALDIATIGTGLARGGRRDRTWALGTLAAVVGITALDLLCARGLQQERRRLGTLVSDYSARSGFPRPPQQMRGVGLNQVELPADARTQESLGHSGTHESILSGGPHATNTAYGSAL